jgi:MFS family permease
VLIASANYSSVALVDIFFRALQPVFLSTPIELGGLGRDPLVIGTIMSFFGILDGVFTVFFSSRLVDYFGVKKVYLIGITSAVPSFVLFPIINYLARGSTERSGKLGTEVWLAVGVQVLLSVVVYLCYGASASTGQNCQCMS